MRLRKLVPSIYEIIGLTLLGLLLVFLGNSRQLLSYYGLQGSSQVIKTSAGDAISNGLNKIDAFSATDKVVTFVIWAFIGMACFSIVQAIGRVGRDLEYDERLSSKKFVHPRTFTRGKFWLQVCKNFLMLVVSLVILSAVVYGIVGFALPASLAYCRIFLDGIKLLNVGDFVIGWGIMAIGLIALDFSLRLVINHQRILQ